MANDDPAGEQAGFIKPAGAGLTDHFPDSGGGRLRIVGGAGVAPGGIGFEIFQIGEVDIHQTLQTLKRLCLVIPSGIIYHGDRKGMLLQQRLDHVGVVGGIDEIDVVSPLGDELVADLSQTLQRDGFAEILMTDFLILAKDTAQAAPGKKDGA